MVEENKQETLSESVIPPIITIRRLGTLDVFDALKDFEQRYPPDALIPSDVTVWDSEGRV